ncbi:uncharacterized protein LOC110941831 [Helianthus annuus]|uniref:uncharacterized protein LOC110941831 n=1 Tax=Helianthus annuus TaxID=4232 RepID=UPI000B909778|nr:uncharacterized protein LOC110941831 [Helianthus annuus]XP_035846164.1 uncharacterized protein LOC110941831 [Helianthus annuus]XP_035846165.1 uncharacterized protein LOC110941831 [Helianthus annuus]XP_035846166.1 uncharacterized protein LOC110941831 [Helianthus annuus]XP_035846167.1 uncharacterized protein LOC110941831 [Helianthus annuus]XP_035846168.1 uncharacterized protein LOC110941831 [Helianthus annuus]XP_035846169.1 uncharacterized protein LOC110941831 [Helianthus annuus]
MLYILLRGVPPFWAESEHGIFNAILKGHVDFTSDPWIKEDGEAPDTPLDNAVLGRLKQFKAMNNFKKVALRVNYYRRTILTPHNTPDHLLCAAASPRRTTSYAGRPGTDTTTATLTWALALLVNHHVVLKIAQQELENHDGRDRKVEESDMNNLVYLQAIIKETMHDASLSSCTTFCST